MFKAKTLLGATMAPDKTSITIDESMMWIEENIPAEYKDISEVSKAYNYLSKADVFKGRIRRRQNWSLMVYQKHLMTSGVMSARSHIHTSFNKYQRNTRPLKIWLFNQKNSLRKGIAQKIASYVKASTRDVTKNFSLYKIILKKSSLIIDKLKLTDEEIYYLNN